MTKISEGEKGTANDGLPPETLLEVSIGKWAAYRGDGGWICIGDGCDSVCFENEAEYQRFLWALMSVAWLTGWKERP